MSIQGADQPPGFPHRRGLGVRARPTRNPGELPPRADAWRAVPAPRSVGEQMPIRPFATLRRPDATRPPWSGDHASTRWPRYAPSPLIRSLCATTPTGPAAPGGPGRVHGGPPNTPGTARPRRAATPAAAETPPPTAAPRRRTTGSLTSSSRRITDTGPSYLKFGAFDLPRRRGTTSPLVTVVVSVDAAAIGIMKPSPTDIDPLPPRYRNLVPLTGLTARQVHIVCAHDPTPHIATPWKALGSAAASQGAAGADPFAHQPDHPRAGRAVRHVPIRSGPDHP